MAKYQLACSCGNNVVVEDRQAGGQVTCPCGVVLDVPTLRKLRHLPLALDESSQRQSAWTLRHGLFALAIIAACGSASLGAYSWWTSPVLEKYDPVAHLHSIDQLLEDMTPRMAWNSWLNFYYHLDKVGFSEFQPRDAAKIKAEQASDRIIYVSAFGVAGICLIGALVVAALPRRRRA